MSRPEPGFGAPAERLGFQPALEGLRAVAVLLVLGVHLGEFVVPSTSHWFFPGGFIGVDVFFVLSGFLIGTILFGEAARSGRVRAARFFGRRALRLVPALVLFLAAHFAYTATQHHASLAHEWSLDRWALAFVANWRTSFGVGQFNDLIHLWSVAMEAQFYLLAVPLVLLLRRLRRARAQLVALGAGIVAIGVVRIVEYAAWHDWSKVYERLDARGDTFLVGMAVAVMWRSGMLRARTVRWAGLLSCGAIGALAFAARFDDATAAPWMAQWGFTVVALAAGAVVAACLTTGSEIRRALSVRPMRAIGRVSYTLYLWHLPVFVWVHRHLDVKGAPAMVVAVALSFALAVPAYFIAERPLLRARDRRLTA